MEIRKLVVSDAEAFFELRLKALKTIPAAFGVTYEEELQYGVERVRERLSKINNDFTLGCYIDGQLVGNLGVYHESSTRQSHKAIIWGVFVHEAHRNKGIGGKLLDEALKLIRQNPKVKVVGLTVDRGSPATRLYESRGFKTWGTEPRAFSFHGDFRDEDHMAILL